MVKAQPDGYHSVTPYLVLDDADAAIAWYVKALGATELYRLPMGGKVGHAEIKIGDSPVMLSDEWPEMDMLGPKARGGTASSLMVYVPDVDASFRRAVDAGATVEDAPTDQFWGDRSARVRDPWGHRWGLATHVEDVAPDEMQRRMEAWSRQAEPA